MTLRVGRDWISMANPETASSIHASAVIADQAWVKCLSLPPIGMQEELRSVVLTGGRAGAGKTSPSTSSPGASTGGKEGRRLRHWHWVGLRSLILGGCPLKWPVREVSAGRAALVSAGPGKNPSGIQLF